MLRLAVAVVTFLFSLANVPALLAQVQRDPQAIAIATQALKSLGGSVPGDSRAVGNYDRVAGSSEDTGTIELLTRNYDQSSEKLTNSGGITQIVYSRGYASQKELICRHCRCRGLSGRRRIRTAII